jgi:hypothetical protein
VVAGLGQLETRNQKLKTAKALLDMVSLKRFERSKAVERLERLERTDPRIERSKAVELEIPRMVS